MEALLLAYIFATFVVGMACIGAVAVLARLREDRLARAFLWLYLPLSAMVLGGLLLAFMELQGVTGPAARPGLEYLEAFIGRYGVMVALPLFAHRIFRVRSGRGTVLLTSVVLAMFAAQHVTEFVLDGGVWDARGDGAEDAVFAMIIAYTLFIAVRRLDDSVYPSLARRFVALLVAGLPAMAFDVFLVDGPGLRLYPLWYCALGVTMALTLTTRRSAATGGAPREWNLTDREEEVFRLMQQGLSNQEIGRQLTISPNTVKTHLRAIFDKSGFRTRVALIAQTRYHPIG